MAAICLAVLLTACGGDERSPEDQLRDMVDGMVLAVEAGSIKQASAYLHDSYTDDWHPNRRAAIRSLFGYLRRHSDIHLFTVVKSVKLDASGDSAALRVIVATAGVPVESVDALVALNADLHRFDIECVRHDGEWQISKARWEKADLPDLTGL